MIVVDTSALIDSLTGPRRSSARMRSLLAEGERLVLPSLVLYEWLRGPRVEPEITAQEALFPRDAALAFGAEEAGIAGRLYGSMARPRGREIDLAIAAHAIALEASLWTLNRRDFEDIPELHLLS